MAENKVSIEKKDLINKRSFDLIEINVSDYKKEYGIHNNTIYNELEKSANRLYNRNIIYFENNDLVTKRWVITCKYKKDNCSVAIQFHPDLIPDLMVFKGCYTKFDFDIKKYIKSFYTCKIYELLKQYESFGVRTFEIDQLRFLLGIEDNEYPEYSNLKQRVIKPATKQISNITDLYCEFEEIKNKRKVEKIRFRFVHQNIKFKIKEQLSLFDDEIAIGQEDNSYNAVKDFRKMLGITISPRQIQKLILLASNSIKEHKLKLGIKEYISQKKIVVDVYAQNNAIKSYLGAIITAIKENWTLTYHQKESTFNNFKQRTYNFKQLENDLLGWNNKDK